MTAITSASFGPWFRRHPRLALFIALGLFAAIFILRFAVGDERDATALLFALPISLLALTFGSQAGASAAAAGVASLVIWAVTKDVHMSLIGWASRVTPLVLLGVLIGLATDTQRRAEVYATRLAVAEERQREAAEINDSIVQSLAVAKWKLEGGDIAGGLEAMEDVIRAGEAVVAGLLSGLELPEEDLRRSRPVAEEPKHFEPWFTADRR